jgi:hypothetical protein
MACRELLDHSKNKLDFAITEALEGAAHAHRVIETLASFGAHEYPPGSQIKNRKGSVKSFLPNREELFNPIERDYFFGL